MKTNRLLLFASLATVLFSTQPAYSTDSRCVNSFELTLIANVKIKFCEIPAAQNVLIGSEYGHIDEKPIKGRNFSKFHIGKYEVTQQQYKVVTGQEPWKGEDFVQEANNSPAVYVDYNEAKQFALKLSRLDPTATYRLPTEAEWEYAARGVEFQSAPYYWGNHFDSNFVFYRGNSKGAAKHARAVTSCPSPSLNNHRPEYCANDYGLMHMIGNVWEWTEDTYVDNYRNAPTDGHVPVTSDIGSGRVMRGGSWLYGSEFMRSAFRNYGWSEFGYVNVGFRLVRIPK